MPSINIDSLTEQELLDLHHRITERLRLFSHLRAHGAMMEFSIGDRVEFNADGRRIIGVITRYNRKTVTLISEGAIAGQRWNVSPSLLTHIESQQATTKYSTHQNVLPQRESTEKGNQ